MCQKGRCAEEMITDEIVGEINRAMNCRMEFGPDMARETVRTAIERWQGVAWGRCLSLYPLIPAAKGCGVVRSQRLVNKIRWGTQTFSQLTAPSVFQGP